LTKTHRDSSGEAEIIADLVTAILAVNVWSLEKVYEMRNGLRTQGLFDLELVASLGPETVTERLVAAGYSLGRFPVPKMAERLIGTAAKLVAGGTTKLRGLIASGAEKELDTFLLELKGIGPFVVSNFKLLQNIPQ